MLTAERNDAGLPRWTRGFTSCNIRRPSDVLGDAFLSYMVHSLGRVFVWQNDGCRTAWVERVVERQRAEPSHSIAPGTSKSYSREKSKHGRQLGVLSQPADKHE
jgi:hypothetical protein